MLDTVKTTTLHVDAANLRYAFEQIRHAISSEETRYYLNGVYAHCVKAGELTLVATDGHWLARVVLRDQGEDVTPAMPGVIIPESFVAAFMKATSKKAVQRYDSALQLAPNRIALPAFLDKWDAIEAEPIDGTYPDYQRVIPNGNPHSATLYNEDFGRCIAAFAAFLNKAYLGTRTSSYCAAPVRLNFTETECHLSAGHWAAGEVKHTLPLRDSFKGQPHDIGFNANYLVDVSKTLSPRGEIIFTMDGPGAPAIIGDGTDECDVPVHATTHVLMPVRV